jgi:dipeptidyl aminopeptidase/acylaminoacyl peptidase
MRDAANQSRIHENRGIGMRHRLFVVIVAPVLCVITGIALWRPAAVTAQGPSTQEAVIAPAENLVVDGVPKIPASLVETAGSYGSYRGANFADWNPIRREILISTRFGDVPQLHLVATPGAARQQLTFYQDSVASARFHPNGGDYILFQKDIGGGEWYQLYRYDLKTGDVTLLTDGKARNLPGPWSSAGDQIAYMSTRRNGKDTDLWLMNPSDPKSDHMVAPLTGGGWEPQDWSADDKKILLTEEISINETYLWLVDTTTGEKTPLTSRDAKEKVFWGQAAFSKDGKGIYVTTDKDSEFQRLAFLDLATKQPKFLTANIPWDVERFDLTHDGKRIAFITDEEGVSALHVMETATQKEVLLPKLPVGVYGGVRWHRNGQDLAFAVNNAKTPGDVYSVNVASGKVDRWTASESAVKTDAFSQAELVHWKSFDGKMISGFLYQPPTGKFPGKRPVLVNIHGGPEGQSQPTFVGRSNYLLNELGIAIIYPNVRGSTGYGKTFSLLDNGFKRDDTYKDINALFDWIATRSDLDTDRIAVTGGSYGGHMTLAVAAFYSGRIRCSVDIVGISNLVTFLEHTEAYRRDLRRVEYGDERDPKMREYLEKIAPMNNIEKIQKPMFVIAGKNDPRVPLSESQQIADALKKQGTPVWLLIAKDEGHGYRKKANQDFQFYATVEFLREYLLK